MVDFPCPYCRAVLRAEPGQQISCGSCGAALNVPVSGGFAVQTVPPPGQDIYAAQTQTYPQQVQQTVPTVPVTPQQQYTPEERARAKAKRDRWGWQSVLIAFVQAMLIAGAMGFSKMLSHSEILLVFWVLSLIPGAALITGLRPDDAFIEKPARPKSRALLFFLVLAALALLTGFFGVMLGGILMIFFA